MSTLSYSGYIHTLTSTHWLDNGNGSAKAGCLVTTAPELLEGVCLAEHSQGLPVAKGYAVRVYEHEGESDAVGGGGGRGGGREGGREGRGISMR